MTEAKAKTLIEGVTNTHLKTCKIKRCKATASSGKLGYAAHFAVIADTDQMTSEFIQAMLQVCIDNPHMTYIDTEASIEDMFETSILVVSAEIKKQ